MKKKASKTGGSRRRTAVKDLSATKSREVKGGKASFNDFQIVKKLDKASPVLFQ